MVEMTPLLEAERITKRYGAVVALSEASVTIQAGKVTCLLGDNGAGKSTLIKILSGVVNPDSGTLRLRGEAVKFRSPTDALDRGIATVFQDLAMVPGMPVYRNFVLGREPTKGVGPLRRLDGRRARAVALDELARFGLREVRRPVATLSGGQRQAVAIAKAIHFGAEVLILDEPTSALGVRQARTVLQCIADAKGRGLGILFITHNVHHAFPAGDTFTVLARGKRTGVFEKGELDIGELTAMMASGEELDDLSTPIRGDEAGARDDG